MNKYKVIPLSREYITQQASNIRKATQTENIFVFPIERIIETLLECMGGNLEILEDHELPSNIPARTISYVNDNSNNNLPYTNTIQVKESVYVGATLGNPEDRFTLAHEMGHAFLFHGYINNNYVCKEEEEIPTKEDPEWQADTFAKELLAPSYLFNGRNHEEIAIKCKLPLKYALQQSDLVIVESFIKYELDPNLGQVFKNKNYVVNYPEIPFPLDQLLLIPSNAPIFRKLIIKK